MTQIQDWNKKVLNIYSNIHNNKLHDETPILYYLNYADWSC